MRRAVVLAALVAAFVFLAPLMAHAHSWYAHRRDPVTRLECCGGSDCDKLVIEPGVLEGVPEGYRLRLTASQAQRINAGRLNAPLDVVIPWSRVQDSEDGNYHLCIPRWNGVTHGDFYCFFAPPNS